MITQVVVEGESDAVIVAALLAPHVPPETFRVTAAGGFSPAISLARTFCLDPNVPVALVLDADSADPAAVRQRWDLVVGNLMPYSDSERFNLFLAEPSTESWLFTVPAGSGAAGKPTAGVTAKGTDPRERLRQLLGGDRQLTPTTLAKAVKPAQMKRAGQRPPMSRLVSFIREQQAGLRQPVTVG